MQQNQQNKDNFIYDLLHGTHIDDLNYIYRGELDSDISNYILSLAERNIVQSKIKGRTKKRVFHIMVESLQNITRHQDYETEDLSNSSFFVIQKNGSVFYITTCNPINNAEIEPLTEKLDKLNQLSKAELTQFYLEMLNNGQITSKGGAGLGLIEIVRKSKNKLYYEFKKINDEKSFVYMHSYIDTSPEEKPIEPSGKIYTFKYLQNLHTHIIEQHILLLYSNLFEQDSLVRLISILKSQKYSMRNNKKRIIASMVELLQNIIQHGKMTIDNKDYSPGIFYISKQDNIFNLHTINYIENKNKDIVDKKLQFINSLNSEDLEDLYNKKLFEFSDNDQNAGLGFIEMKMKSKHQLTYSFEDLDKDYSIFLLKLTFKDTKTLA